MANDGGVLIDVNLNIDTAEKKINSLAKKLANAQLDIEINGADLERAIQKAEELQRIRDELKKQVKTETVTEWGYFDGHWGERTVTRQTGRVQELEEAEKALEAQRDIVTQLEKKQEQLNEDLKRYEELLELIRENHQNDRQEEDEDDYGAGSGKGKASREKGKFEKRFGTLMGNMQFEEVAHAVRAVRKVFLQLIKDDNEMKKALAGLKGSLLTLISPIVNVLLPAIRTAIQLLNLLAQQIGTFVFSIFGLSWGDASKGAEKMSKALKSGAGSAKKMQNSLMGIDEINRLDDPNSGGGGGSSINPSFDPAVVTEKLLEIEAIALGASLALGLILALSGVNVGLGIALIAIGALGLASEINVNWNEMSERTQQIIGTIVEVATVGLVAIGLVLLFAGRIGLGIGMIIAGGALGATTIPISWKSIPTKVQEVVSGILKLVSSFLVVLGVVLLFLAPLSWGLAVGLILAGITGWVSAVAIDWSATGKNMSDVIGKITTIVATSLFVLGFLLALLGHPAMGIAMIIAGGALVASVNWNYIPEKVSEIVGKIKEKWTQFREFLRTQKEGISTNFSNAIGNLKEKWNGFVEGIKTKFTTFKTNVQEAIGALKTKWGEFTSSIKEKLTSAWENVKGVFKKGGQIFEGIKEGISDTFKRIVNGLIDGINTIIKKPFDVINGALIKIRDLNIAGLTPFKGKISTISIPQIPHLAQGAVIPPNNKFLAMLGDNKKEQEIVSPLSTMKDALAQALSESRQNITVNIDGKKLFEIVVGQNNAEVRRTGESPLLV